MFPRERIKSDADTPPYALVLGRFPPCAVPPDDTVATVVALLEEGYAVETISTGGHGDAHLALDFAKAHALRSLRAAVQSGPRIDYLALYPSALMMRRPDRLARAYALLQQLFTLGWLALRARRVTIFDGRPGGWRGAAPLALAVLRIASIGRRSSRSTPDLSQATKACTLAATAWGRGADAHLALEVGTLLRGPLGVMLPPPVAPDDAGPSPDLTAAAPMMAALAPDPVWSSPGISVAAWMVHLRAARNALPRLVPGGDRAAKVLRGWALTELDGDGTLAGMRAALNGYGRDTSPTPASPPADRVWRDLSRAGALRSPLRLSEAEAHASSDRSHETARTLHTLIKLSKMLGRFRRDDQTEAQEPNDALTGATIGQPVTQTASNHSRAPALIEDRQADRDRALTLALAAGLPDGLPTAEAPVGPRLAAFLNQCAAVSPDDASMLQRVLATASCRTAAVGRTDALPTPGLRLIGHASAEMGLGANLAMSAAALAHEGIASKILSADNGLAPLPGPPAQGPEVVAAREATVLHVNADRVPQTLLHPRLMRPGHRGPTIGLLLWEFEVLPGAHALALEMLDEIWAPTPFVADAYRDAAARCGTRVEVVHKALPGGSIVRMDRSAFGLPDGPFLFLASFDFHSSVERKNPLALVRAFTDAFPAGAPGASDVALVLKTTEVMRGHWGDPHDQWTAISVAAAQDPRIRVLTGRLEAPVYRALLAAADCYVSPHRAEGFGYGPAEAMRLGRPVVATDWSGSTAFCTKETAFPVPAKLVPVAPGETIHPVPGARWAEIDHDAFVATLRDVVQDESGRETRAAAGARLMAERYGLAAHGARLRDRLTKLGVLSGEAPDRRQRTAA
ncbi:MAG: glycosyltransferase [Pseudomonadota bacterium]